MEDDEAFGQGTGEARDSISHLRDIGVPHLAVKVSTCSNVC